MQREEFLLSCNVRLFVMSQAVSDMAFAPHILIDQLRARVLQVTSLVKLGNIYCRCGSVRSASHSCTCMVTHVTTVCRSGVVFYM